jgi:hypothetical protein
MGTRQKLNAVNFLGCVAVAGIVGAVFQSWLGFSLALASLVACHLHTGEIRINKPKR